MQIVNIRLLILDIYICICLHGQHFFRVTSEDHLEMYQPVSVNNIFFTDRLCNQTTRYGSNTIVSEFHTWKPPQ